jgi:hypothetical protein
MNQKILSSVLVLFTLSSCQFFGGKDTEFVALDPEVSQMSAFDQSLQLDTNYISNFRLDGFTDPGEDTKYLIEKQKLIDAYNAWDRSLNLIRAYIYLTWLEGNFAMKSTLEAELCKLHAETCAASLVEAAIIGTVTDSNGKPRSNVTVEVLGTKHFATTDNQWKYNLVFQTQSPTVLRLRASTDSTMIDVKKIEIDDNIRKSYATQKFERNFTLINPLVTYEIDTEENTIAGKGSQKNTNSFTITTDYTKYIIPFGTIVNGTTPYKGKLKAMVFEFDRASGASLLDADSFDSIEWFASSLFVTYGMPYIVFIADDGSRLDVLSTNPMYIATTLRERDDFMKTARFDKLYQMAYAVSQKDLSQYPITNKWLFDNGNFRIIPPWWVLDRSTGFWDNVGMRFATANPESPYNIEAPFYTIRVGTR